MCVASTAKRRRKQAANGYTHLCERQRPHYKKISAEKSANRLHAMLMTERRMKAGKKK